MLWVWIILSAKLEIKDTVKMADRKGKLRMTKRLLINWPTMLSMYSTKQHTIKTNDGRDLFLFKLYHQIQEKYMTRNDAWKVNQLIHEKKKRRRRS